MQTTGSRPQFRSGLFQLSIAGLLAGYHFRRQQQFAARDRNSRLKDEQKLAALDSLAST